MAVLPSCNGPYDDERLRPRCDCVRQRCVWQLMRQILPAGKEPQERSALFTTMITDRPTQHRIPGLERVQHGVLRSLAFKVELHLAANLCQRAQMRREHDSDHDSVWTSTESTAGRSRTIGAQLSPASADAYTCPPVVPKYTPQESSESTAIASRSTLT